MAQKTGTFDINSLFAATNTSAVEIGFDTIAATLAADNANLSALIEDFLSDLAVTSTDRQRVVGTSISGDAMEVDEYGQGPTQKDMPSYFVGFPLRKFQFNVGFTDQWLKNAKGADIALKNEAAQGAFLRQVRYQLQKAIYTPTNYTFKDHLVDGASLPVKAFLNADSAGIANGPNGETFDGSAHTHYDAISSLTAGALKGLITDIVEHRNGAVVRICINTADVATVSALTGFQPLLIPQVTVNANANQVANPRLNLTQTDNRLIGYFEGAEVWTKPWAVANYAVAIDVSATQKPLVRRVETNDRGIHLAATLGSHPLHAQMSEYFFGFGVWNRSAVAILRFNNASYATPALSY